MGNPPGRRVPALFLGAYAALLVALSFYVADVGSAMAVDPHRLYNIDELDRYYYVRCAPQDPILLLNPQVRPVHYLIGIPFTQALYSMGIQGITAHRLLNVFLSVAALGLLYGVLRRLKFVPALALGGLAAVALNPVYLAQSISTGGEVMLLAAIALSLYLHYSGRPAASLVVMGFAPLVRWEGFPVLGLWGLYHLYQAVRNRELRQLRVLAVAALPTLAYIAIQHLAFGDPLYLLRYQAEDSYYFRLFHPTNVERGFLGNLASVAPPILYAYGPLFVALGLAGAALTGRRHLAVLAAALGVLGFWMFYLAFLSMEAMDRRFLPVFALGVVPVVALLDRLRLWAPKSATGGPPPGRVLKRAGPVLAGCLLAAMLLWNGSVFAQKVDAFSGCCNDRTYLPAETMGWVRNYTARPDAGTVYWPVGAYRLFLLDDTCTLAKAGTRFYVGPASIPGQGCTWFQWHLDTVKHTVAPPAGGVLITRGEVDMPWGQAGERCMPPGLDPVPAAQFVGEGLTAYPVGGSAPP